MGTVDPARSDVAGVAKRLLDDPLWERLAGEHPPGAVEVVRGAVERLAEPSRRFRLYCDGGSHGNPGPSGAGGLVLDDRGEEVDRFSVYLGVGTNNTAEYRALLVGLERVARWKPVEVEILLDSQLLVRQIDGRYKVRSAHLAPLHREALARLRRIPRWSIRHVPREENRTADRLVRRAIEGRKKAGG